MKNENVRMATSKQLLELAAIFVKNLPLDELDAELTQNWIENPKAIAKGVREMLVPPNRKLTQDKIAKMIDDWELFYYEEFGLKLNLDHLSVPTLRPGFDRLLVIPQGLTIERVIERCGELFPIDKTIGVNFDEEITDFVREKNRCSAYAIWVRDRIEADKEHKNKSADDIKKQGILGINLKERLIHEIEYFKESGEHLDLENITLCAGSRDSHGEIPTVECNDEVLCIFFAAHHEADAHLRVREVVCSRS